jgi:hypothetical protein
MGIAKFTQTNYTTQNSSTYKSNIDSDIQVMGQIAGRFAVHAQDTPNMTVKIDAGYLFNGITPSLITAQSTSTITAPVTNPRYDRICLNASSGAYLLITGTESASPSVPAITAGAIPLAYIYLTVGMTSITNSDITDERATFSVTDSAIYVDSAGRIGLNCSPNTDVEVTLEKNGSGEYVTQRIRNSNSSTAGSHANLELSTAQAASDPCIVYSVTGMSWWTGPDNDDSDAYKVTSGSIHGTGNTGIKVSTSGQVTMPLQPTFIARKSALSSNATGDSTAFTVVYDTEIRDIGSNYNNSTGVFTAPVDGTYTFCFGAGLSSIGASHTLGLIKLITSNRTYQFMALSAAAIRDSGNNAHFHGAVIADMEAGDTASVQVVSSGSTLTVGVIGDSVSTYFMGSLKC